MQAEIRIPRDEFEARRTRLLTYVREQNLSGVVLFAADYVLYFTGFAFIPTERPIAFLMNAEGEPALFLPALEVEHGAVETGFTHIAHYPEYPGTTHPMQILRQTLQSMGITGAVGADTDGYPWIYGYRGPALSDLVRAPVERVAGCVEDLMAIKSPNEVALIRESARWGNLAHRLLQRYTRPGATETEVSSRASDEATAAMIDTLGHLYRSESYFFHGASAGYRGQIGRNAAIPHALANNVTFQPGDVLVTGAGAAMWGYHSELERTMFVGAPSPEARRMFHHMVALQDTAFRSIRPGNTCADVDRAVRNYYEEHDLMPYWKHHTGHAIGLRYHEGPFLDIGDTTPLLPGMVFTVEPGLYAPQMGGFRHSDTVLVSEDGMEMLTYYPRDLESLTIPA